MTRRRVLALAVTVLTLSALALGTAAASSSGAIMRGVSVAGIPLGGLSESEARTKLAVASKMVDSRTLELVVGGRSWKRTPYSLGITADLDATIDRAMQAGRDNPLQWALQSFSNRSLELEWAPQVDRAVLDKSVTRLADDVKVEASNGGIELKGSTVVARPPTEGVRLLADAAERQLTMRALGKLRGGKLPLPVTITPPEIDADDVRKVEQQAKEILAAPVEFAVAGRTVTLSPERVAAALTVSVVESSGDDSLELEADAGKLEEQIAAAAPDLVHPPQDARFTVESGNVIVHPSADGTSVDTSVATEPLLNLKAQGRTQIELPTKVQPADFSTEAAQSLRIRERIATFTTYFDPQNAPRVGNIDKMASAIDGKVIKPGEDFSLNAATGPRTPQNGYQEAQVIVDGELVPGIGGGVCQVATTVFNAVYSAGLDVLERVNHSLYISKYPIGRDATLNFGHQDLRFRNDTEYGVLLKAAVTAKAMIVSVYSSPNGRTVETTVSERTNPKPFPTKYIDDPALPTGVEKQEAEGIDGFDITVTRKVVLDGKVLHEEKFVSKYRPWKRIIRRGTGPPASPSPSPSPR